MERMSRISSLYNDKVGLWVGARQGGCLLSIKYQHSETITVPRGAITLSARTALTFVNELIDLLTKSNLTGMNKIKAQAERGQETVEVVMAATDQRPNISLAIGLGFGTVLGRLFLTVDDTQELISLIIKSITR